jgi:hypothetical protein
VQDAALVGVVDGPGHGLDQFRRLTRCQRRVGEAPGEAAAVHELQREVGQAVVLADFEDLDDIRVLQAGDRLGLPAEAGQFLRELDARPHHLQGHDALEPEMPRLVDDAHAAVAEDAQDLVARYVRYRHAGARRGCSWHQLGPHLVPGLGERLAAGLRRGRRRRGDGTHCGFPPAGTRGPA